MKATVRCPGSCGELVQGTTAGLNFLVTCPISLYSQVSVNLSTEKKSVWNAGNKTMEAVQKTLEYLEMSFAGIHIQVDSELPVGKGMASSSADISAACLATAIAAGRSIDNETICKIALDIEPTDGIFLAGITMLDHVTGKVCRAMGDPPAITIAVLDAGGEVDTIDFNHRSDLAALNCRKEPEVLAALRMVEQGIQSGDCSLIGAGATLSALANQSILFKPSLERIIAISRSFGAVGVNAAHSGTVLGIMFDTKANSDVGGCIDAVCRECSDVRFFRTAQMVSGGLSIVRDSIE
ncbi:MAG TPA: GHMP kinase [Negativicutes bacterium]|nr:GHMP kinase [Negativicutes bacterium]